jgi:nicotinate-nucleotide pyrophosphorylase (carboxylating)
MSAYVALDRDDVRATLVRLALAEDVGPGDWTTLWTVPEGARARSRVVAREDVVVSGSEAARAVFEAVDPALEVREMVGHGMRAPRGTTVLEVSGSARSILTAERTALNFLGHLTGIATLTRAFVDRVEGTRARIVDTRKTTPGWRLLEKRAVRAGGGFNHRMGLHDMILIKENHIAAAGGITQALQRVRARDSNLLVEVEVRTPDELDEALALSPHRILLDNMTPELLAVCVERAEELEADRPELEASGNIRLETVRAVAESGVDLISVGAITHSAPAGDLSLLLDA